MHNDSLKLIFLACDIQTIGRCSLVCKEWKAMLSDPLFWNQTTERDFGKKVDPKYALGEYKSKIQILHRIQDTARAFAEVANEHGILWAISGGLCLRYHGVNRMTRDLDIILLHRSTDDEDPEDETLDWWEIETDPILRYKKWIHAGNPFQSSQLNMNYANSWAHPDLRIHMDICTYPLKDVVVEWGNDNLPYCSLQTILAIKSNSRKQRKRVHDRKGYWKDVRDLLALTKLYGIDPIDYLEEEEISNPKTISKREFHKSFYSALLLEDYDMINEIVYFETPPNGQLALIDDGTNYLKERDCQVSKTYLKQLRKDMLLWSALEMDLSNLWGEDHN